VTHFTGQNRLLKKVDVIGMLKSAEHHSPWAACMYFCSCVVNFMELPDVDCCIYK